MARVSGCMAATSASAARRNCSRRARRSAGSATAPTTDAQRPVARKRSYSICQRRSCAAAKPIASQASGSDAASMWATPSGSRRMEAAPVSPSIVSSPSSRRSGGGTAPVIVACLLS